jgi:hypothetical protein
MLLRKVVLACLLACSLSLNPVDAAETLPPPPSAPGGSGLFAAECKEGSVLSQPLPPRPVLARRTFAAHMPGRPIAKRKTLSRKTLAHKPVINKKAPPRKIVPPAHKPVAKRPAAKKPTHAAHRPVHKPVQHAAARPTLRKATFASPICGDRAPVLQAFGVDTLGLASFNDELARAIEDALAPQNAAQQELADAADSAGNSPDNGNPGFNLPSVAFPSSPGFGGGFFPVPPAGTGPGGGAGNGNTGSGGNGGGDTGTGGGNTGAGGGGDTGTGGGNTGAGGGDTGGSGGTPGNPDGTTPTSPGSVPEPASWMMMILGFGGIGVMIRRRRTRLARI